MRRKLALFLSLSLLAGTATAAEIAIPSQAEWAGAKQHVTLPNGINMAYVEMGNTTGRPLLLIHGYSDSSRTWSTIAPYLKDRHLIAIDLRGHGASTAPQCCYTMMDFSNDLSLFISTMGLGKVDVAGHSLGTMVGQTLAATHPEQVNKLVLLAGSPMGASPTGGWLWDNVMALKDPIDPTGKFMNDWYFRPNPVKPPEFDEFAKREAAKMPTRVWQGVILANTMTDLSTIDSLIKAPTLIVAGGKDGLLNKPHQDRLPAAIPQAQFILIPEAGHGLFKEFPERSRAW
jgi:pimeloyl-ACP methyl ester carboxylesterase